MITRCSPTKTDSLIAWVAFNGMSDTLGFWAEIASIVAVPVAVVAWFLGGKYTTARAAKGETAIAGDVTAGNGGLAIGHYNQITLGTAHAPRSPEETASFAGVGQGRRFQIGIGDFWEYRNPRKPPLKVTLKAIKTERDAPGLTLAELSIDAWLYLSCGHRVKRLDDDHYLVQEVKGSPSPYVVHACSIGNLGDGREYFFSEVLFVEHINAHTGVVTMRFFTTDTEEERGSTQDAD